ncbi:dihydrolipoyl dehydrogenase [Psychrobacter aestuarii]|uniref:Dihydrolipoyl dehydrogenase n=1 Tax=Psychrobacter aestuarii TaxID=556327 RepID=A0ABN0VMD9_9GAMM|nr:dihydrolipoyl dehydrogenase [Psychrobacter aestuarii]
MTINNNTNRSDTSRTVTRSVAVAIIGAGTAGQNAFRQASKQTDDIVIINDGFWTTTCATVGCMPSKLLIAAADRAHEAKTADIFGVHAEVEIDGKAVMARVQAERDHFVSFSQKQVNDWDDDKKIAGQACINADGNIEVNDECIEAQHIIIATGSSPFIPEGWAETLGDSLLTSDTVFELQDLPASLAVVGAGAIGLELAQAFARLGVEVTLFNRVGRVGGLKDKDVNQQAITCLSNELTLELDSKINEVACDSQDGTLRATIDYCDHHGEQKQWQGERVLVATGRRNNIERLGVTHLGVSLDDKNRPQDLDKNTGRIGDLNVYIIGDANAHLPILHVASDEGFSAGHSVCLNDEQSHLRPPSIPLSIVFCEPQIATVGMSLPEIEAQNLEYVIGKVNFSNQGRSRIMAVNCGKLHIYACAKTDKILGACMAAPDGEYIAHILAIAITNEMSIKTLLESPFYHPTILEGLRSALRHAQEQMSIPHQS